jgi:hypothetical protein
MVFNATPIKTHIPLHIRFRKLIRLRNICTEPFFSKQSSLSISMSILLSRTLVATNVFVPSPFFLYTIVRFKLNSYKRRYSSLNTFYSTIVRFKPQSYTYLASNINVFLYHVGIVYIACIRI